jgi:hypothetical protein
VTPPVEIAAEAAPPASPPLRLSEDRLRRLQRAAGRARVLGVAGLSASTLLILGLLVADAAMSSALSQGTVVLMLFVACLLIAGSSQMYGYGKNVRAFLADGEPFLLRAFQNLRRLWILWIGTSVATALASIVLTLKRLRP